jgi:transposase
MNVRHITLSEEERAALITGWKTGKQHTFRSRCNLVILSDQGYDMGQIADLLGITRQTVANWLNRYEAGGIAALHTIKGQGRPPIVRHDNRAAIDKIEKLVEKYPQKIDQALIEIEEFTGKPMSKKTLKRILKKTAGVGSASAAAHPSGRRPKS